MTKYTYPPGFFEKAKQKALAKQALTETMYKFTQQHGELTTIEWIALLTEQIQRMVMLEESEEGEDR